MNDQPPQPDEAEQGRDPTEQPAQPTPRIYVASLSDYNAGRLHGTWLNAARPSDQLQAEIDAMLAASAEPRAEEWAIHDFEGFAPAQLSEYEPLDRVSEIALGIAEHGEAFAAWATIQRDSGVPLNAFYEHYRGCWDDLVEYADDLLESVGATAALEELPDWLQPHVQLDVAGFARDLELGGEDVTVAGSEGLHVFDDL